MCERVGRRRSRRLVLAPAALAVLCGLAAIAEGQPAGPPAHVRVGLSGHTVTFLPLYLAMEQLLFRREGLEVEVASFGGGTRAAAALASGSIDIVGTSLESIIVAIGGGHPVRVFYSPSGGTPFSWYARPDVTGWTDLRGRRVAVSNFGSVTDVLTRFALRRHGLEAGRDVYIVQGGEPAVRLAALRAGRVDAAILFPPHTYAAEAQGLRYLGSQSTEVGEPWPLSLLAAREEFLAGRAETVRAFLRAYVAGMRLARADRELAVRILAERLKYAPRETALAYDDVVPGFDERGRLPASALQLFWRIVTEMGEVTEPWPEERFLDRRFIDTFERWAPR
jgi:NitT/TauT family transport system substrate-binding protein